MAAPHVAGLIALVMQTAQEPLTNAEIRQTLTNTARHAPPPNAINWDPMYGFGRVNGAAFIEAFQQQDVAPVP